MSSLYIWTLATTKTTCPSKFVKFPRVGCLHPEFPWWHSEDIPWNCYLKILWISALFALLIWNPFHPQQSIHIFKMRFPDWKSSSFLRPTINALMSTVYYDINPQVLRYYKTDNLGFLLLQGVYCPLEEQHGDYLS